jgi:hypothetical protein
MQLSEKDFLEKYGNEKVEFLELYKYRMVYHNEQLKFYCSGALNQDSEMRKTETVNSVAKLDAFQFRFYPMTYENE